MEHTTLTVAGRRQRIKESFVFQSVTTRSQTLADLVNLGPCAAKAELAPVVLKDRLEVWSMHHVCTQRGLGSGVRDSAICTTLNSGREPDITATPAHQDKVIINHCFLKKNKYFQEVEIRVQMLGRGQRAELTWYMSVMVHSFSQQSWGIRPLLGRPCSHSLMFLAHSRMQTLSNFSFVCV